MVIKSTRSKLAKPARVARVTGTSSKTVSEGSSGRRREDNIHTLKSIAASLNVDGMKLDAVCLTRPPGGRVLQLRLGAVEPLTQWLVIDFRREWRETVRTVNDHWRVHHCGPLPTTRKRLRRGGTLSATSLSHGVAATNVAGTVDGTSLQLDSSPNLIDSFGGPGWDASPTRTPLNPQRASRNVFRARVIWHSSKPNLPR